ncbi:Replication factor A protein [Lachnellula subtilissima]|uniref:Replication protein A subunit n=1 Tax=Lachnellula subtilissima TaxID=602034 RepID=A0A8H8U6K0_9HELO|nr:Replication factor A protein [Lachnellula subtilissima]
MAEAAKSHITQGALNAIFNEPSTLNRDYPVPICQVVQIKTLGSQTEGTPERYRLVLSDVQNFVQSMLATRKIQVAIFPITTTYGLPEANHVVHDGKLKKGSIVRLKAFQANAVKGKRILIVLDLEVIESLGELEKIGEPVVLKDKDEEDVKPVNTTIAGGGFYGNKPAEPTRQQQALPSRAAPTSSASHANIYPIEGLSPYAHKWTIKARVTSKSEIKEWKKATEGKLFSVNLLDESGEIKATGFNEQCDQLYDVLQEGSVYYISSPCRVNLAKKQFSNLSNDYELTFDRDTTVEKAEDQESVPQIKFNFTNIASLQEIDKDTTIDILGVLKDVAEVSEITSKSTHRPYSKREITLVDQSGYSVKLTVWGKLATSFDANPESIIAFKGAKVSDFGGRSLSLLSSGSMSLDPDISEAHQLKGWYDSQGRRETFLAHTGMSAAGAAGGRREETKTVAQIKEEGLGMNPETPDYFNVKATIVYIKQDSFSYPACLSPDCNKKVTDEGDGTWRCEKCNINHPKPEHRYILTLSVSDHTGQMYLNAFDDVGRLVVGKSADEMMELKENDFPAMEKEFENANCTSHYFKCRAKMDTYQDQQRVRYQVMSAIPIDFKAEAHKLAELIKLYNIE